jgi:hypothetical protein
VLLLPLHPAPFCSSRNATCSSEINICYLYVYCTMHGGELHGSQGHKEYMTDD